MNPLREYVVGALLGDDRIVQADLFTVRCRIDLRVVRLELPRNAKRRLEETAEPPALPASTALFDALDRNDEHVRGCRQIGQRDVVSVLQQVGDDRVTRLGDLDVLSTIRVCVSAEHKGLVNLCQPCPHLGRSGDQVDACCAADRRIVVWVHVTLDDERRLALGVERDGNAEAAGGAPCDGCQSFPDPRTGKIDGVNPGAPAQ